MASIGTLTIDFAASIARLEKDVKQAAGAVKQASEQIDSAVGFAKTALGTLGIGLSVGYFVSLIKGSIDAADHLQDLGKATGIAVEQLAGLKLASAQTGSDLDSIAASINKLSVNIGKDAEKFKALGIDAKDPLIALQQLADVYVRLQDPQQRAAVAAEALGKSWAGTAPLLAEGGKRIAEIVDRGSKLSGITKDLTRDADQFNDQMAELNLTLGMTKTKLVGEMLPAMNEVALAMRNASTEGGILNTVWAGMVRTTSVWFENLDTKYGVVADRIAKINKDFARSAPGADPADAANAAAKAKAFLDAEKLASDRLAGDKKLAEEKKRLLAEDTKGWVAFAQAQVDEWDRANKELAAISQQYWDNEERLRQIGNAGWVAYAQARIDADEQANAAQARITEDHYAQLDRLRNQYLPEEQDEKRYNDELIVLNSALANERITQEEHDRLQQEIELQHQAKMGNISAQGQLERLRFTKLTGLQQTAFVLDFLQQQTAGVANQNRAMFNLNKAVGIAQAILSTYIGANKALEWGWPLGPIFAGVIIAAGLANVARIASSKFDSSTSAPSISGGGAIPVTQVSASPPPQALATPVPTPAAPRQQINVTFVGEFFDYETIVNKFIPLLNEAGANGADIHVQAT